MSLTNEELEATHKAAAGTAMLLSNTQKAVAINSMFLKCKGSDEAARSFHLASSLLCVAVARLTSALPDHSKAVLDASDFVMLYHGEDMLDITIDCMSAMRDAVSDPDKASEPVEGDMRTEIIAHLDAFLNYVMPWKEEMDRLQKLSVEAVEKKERK